MISLFKHTADIYEYKETVDEWGTTQKEWLPLHLGIKCTFGKKANMNSTNSEATKSNWRYTLHIPLETVIPIGSKVIFKEMEQEFKAQQGMIYTYLKKKEIELTEWQ